MTPQKTKVKVIREKDGKEASRMDIIGQNGNDGLHYGKIDDPISLKQMKEFFDKDDTETFESCIVVLDRLLKRSTILEDYLV